MVKNNTAYLSGAASIILLISFFSNPVATSKNVANILMVEGSYFLVQHVLTDFANNHNELIGFTAHCTSAFYGVQVLKTGVDGVKKVGEKIEKFATRMEKIAKTFGAVKETTEKAKESFEVLNKFSEATKKYLLPR